MYATTTAKPEKNKKRIELAPRKSICVEDYQKREESQSKQKVGKGKGKRTVAKENDKNNENTSPKKITEETGKSLNKVKIKLNASYHEND